MVDVSPKGDIVDVRGIEVKGGQHMVVVEGEGVHVKNLIDIGQQRRYGLAYLPDISFSTVELLCTKLNLGLAK